MFQYQQEILKIKVKSFSADFLAAHDLTLAHIRGVKEGLSGFEILNDIGRVEVKFELDAELGFGLLYRQFVFIGVEQLE